MVRAPRHVIADLLNSKELALTRIVASAPHPATAYSFSNLKMGGKKRLAVGSYSKRRASTTAPTPAHCCTHTLTPATVAALPVEFNLNWK